MKKQNMKNTSERKPEIDTGVLYKEISSVLSILLKHIPEARKRESNFKDLLVLIIQNLVQKVPNENFPSMVREIDEINIGPFFKSSVLYVILRQADIRKKEND